MLRLCCSSCDIGVGEACHFERRQNVLQTVDEMALAALNHHIVGEPLEFDLRRTVVSINLTSDDTEEAS